MVAEPKIKMIEDSISTSEKRPSDVISQRRSKELIIAFSGPIGCGINPVKEHMQQELENAGYIVHHIKISEYLKQCINDKLVCKGEVLHTFGGDRYIQMQDAGNELRAVQSDILAEYAITKVAEIRTSQTNESEELADYIPERTAYFIDQLKHPEEVMLLRTVYGNLFYLFGVLSITSRREKRLDLEGVNHEHRSLLIERDRKERLNNGQQLDKALQLADFFIRNDHYNMEAIKSQIQRFIKLIHGENGLSPTKAEYGMYAAYASGLRSSCLSRQVGAAIMSPEGIIIATGRNDVPKFGGGLYSPESGSVDARCIKLEGEHCYNDIYKRKLVDDIKDILKQELESLCSSSVELDRLSTSISESAYKNTRLSGLIEFSRSIHAEMDAIVSLALKGNNATKDATLFTYTFPCHNCARHIVAAGISTVYYLEPYEKSLALELHSDAISIDGTDYVPDENGSVNQKVSFLHFEGVAPRQYLNMFNPSGDRKDKSGKAIKISIRNADKKVPEYLDAYRDYELKVIAHMQDLLEQKLKV
jgi:deoxycytidylate deaminase